MVWLRDRAVLVVVLVFGIGLALDFVLWERHPFALIAGGTAAKFVDPLVLVAGLVIGLVAGLRWQAVIAALVVSVGVELLAATGSGREMLGRSGWSTQAYVSTVLAVCILAALAASIAGLMARSKA